MNYASQNPCPWGCTRNELLSSDKWELITTGRMSQRINTDLNLTITESEYLANRIAKTRCFDCRKIDRRKIKLMLHIVYQLGIKI